MDELSPSQATQQGYPSERSQSAPVTGDGEVDSIVSQFSSQLPEVELSGQPQLFEHVYRRLHAHLERH